MIRQSCYLILFGLIGLPPCLHAQSPGGVNTNLNLWVKAESALPAAGGNLTKWTDQTAKNTFSISAAGAKTVTNVINFHPIVRFTGAQVLTGNNSINWSECSAVASWSGNPTTSERGTVISPTTSGSDPTDASRYYFRSGLEGTGYLYAGMGVASIGFEYLNAPPSGVFNEYTAAGVGNVFNMNGVDARIGSLYGGYQVTTMSGIPQIGDRSTSDSKMIGDIAEIIVYGSSNSLADRNKVESYLALKYGLTMGNSGQNITVNYTSSSNLVFWTGMAKYQHNIFGIGHDVASGLSQIASNSINSGGGTGTGISGMGNLTLTAVGTMADQQFLMIGTDSGLLSTITMTAPATAPAITAGPAAAVGSIRVRRNWRVQNTGTVGAVNLTFDINGLAGFSTTFSKYYLMIDNDGDGDYTTGTQSYVRASSLTGTKVSFNSVTLKNNVVFTIITLPNTIIPLPVSWENFTANAQQDMADLQWTVDGQPGTAPTIDHFVIERSIDATNFSAMANVAAANTIPGSSTATGRYAYEFREQLSPGNYYYRIRLVDQDGEYQYSSIRSVSIAVNIAALQILSNPVRDNELHLQIDWPQNNNNTVLIRIADRQGNILLQKESSLQQGVNRQSIDCTRLPGGLYYVQIGTEKEKHTLSFLKY